MMPSWSAMPIRVRLTAWYAAVTALMLVLYATATFLAVRHEFQEQFDAHLRGDFERTARSLIGTRDGRISWSDDERHDADAERAAAYSIWSIDGEELYRSGAPIPRAFELTMAGRDGGAFTSVDAEGRQWRTFTRRTTIGDRAVLLSVSRSAEPLLGQVSEVLVVLVLGLPLVVALAGLGGYALARRALAPIDHLGADARRITADRLHERLVVPNPRDEIGRLAAVINQTFGRLESSFDRLRRFTADASHELRTPLSVIRAIGEAGLAEPRTPAEYREALSSMLEEVDRVTHLVETLLRLSHADAGTVRPAKARLDLGQLARDVVSSLGLLAEERGQCVNVSTSGPVPVDADCLILREAVTNVIDNAIKYSPRGSTIDVVVRAADDTASLTVADEGPGIAPQHRERIFDRFFRVDDSRSRAEGGSGLGLAIAKWAVEINGGSIAVGPRPERRGSSFQIVLPFGGSLEP